MRLAVVAAAAVIFIPNGHATTLRSCTRPTAAKIASLPSQYPRFNRALHRYFGSHWLEAAIVSYGEGSWHSFALNGQYEGTFQMGSSERATYGHGPTLEEQTHAASRYSKHGTDWSHWDCQP